MVPPKQCIVVQAVLVVELTMGIYAFKRTHTLLDACIILMLFPASLVFVYVLENVFHLD